MVLYGRLPLRSHASATAIDRSWSRISEVRWLKFNIKRVNLFRSFELHTAGVFLLKSLEKYICLDFQILEFCISSWMFVLKPKCIAIFSVGGGPEYIFQREVLYPPPPPPPGSSIVRQLVFYTIHRWDSDWYRHLTIPCHLFPVPTAQTPNETILTFDMTYFVQRSGPFMKCEWRKIGTTFC